MSTPDVQQTLTIPPPVKDFDSFYQAQFHPLVALAWARVGQREDAIDLAQYALIEASRHWSKVSALERPDLWVRRIVLNRASNHRRSRRRESRAISRLQALPQPATSDVSQSTENFLNIIRSLPDQQAAAVALRYLHELSLQEIADVLGVTVGTVKTTLHRARHSLASSLSKEETAP